MAVSESAWLYALFGVAGIAVGGGGSPLGWVAVLAILVCALVVARSLQAVVLPVMVAYLLQMVAGVIVIYLTVGTQVPIETGNIDLGWVGTLASGPDIEGYTFRGAAGGVFGVLLWWRGGRIGATDYPTEALAASFRLGILALALATIVDVVSSADLNVFPMIFIFFAGGLAGLSVGRLFVGSQTTAGVKTWTRVIAGVVSVVLLTGLAVSLLRKEVLRFITDPALEVFGLLATVVFYVFVVPVAFVVNAIMRVVGRVAAAEPVQIEGDAPGFAEQFVREEGPPPGYIDIIEWFLLAVLVLAVLYLLARAYRRRQRGGPLETVPMRESVREGADPTYDLANLLFNLLPSGLKSRRLKRELEPPEGDPGIVEAFRIYYRLLTRANAKGVVRAPSETVVEYQGSLETVFPERLVRMATEAFNGACYGDRPASPEQIGEMRLLMEEAGIAEPQ